MTALVNCLPSDLLAATMSPHNSLFLETYFRHSPGAQRKHKDCLHSAAAPHIIVIILQGSTLGPGPGNILLNLGHQQQGAAAGVAGKEIVLTPGGWRLDTMVMVIEKANKYLPNV